MRHYAWVVVAAALAGCGGGGTDYAPEPVTSYDTEFEVDADVYAHPRTSELGTDRTRGVAKTIEWQKAGTEIGTAYCAGAVVVDHILRHDAQNFYGVTVRVKNTRNEAQRLQWRILFYSLHGETLLGFNEDWKSIVLDPLGHESVTDSCRLKGATAFRLFLRAGGASDEGLPDGFKSGRQ